MGCPGTFGQCQRALPREGRLLDEKDKQKARATKKPAAAGFCTKETAFFSVRENLGEELFGALARRFLKELLLGAVFKNLARFHKDHAVSDLTGKAHFVRHHLHRQAAP